MSTRDSSAAIVVAGGTGTRFGSMKQFADFFGFPVIAWCVRELLQVVGHIVIVLPEQVLADTGEETILKTACALSNCERLPEPADRYFAKSANLCPEPEKAITLTAGGETRSESVRNGLRALPVNCSVVIVHDAARPLARADLFRRVTEKIGEGYEGATCYLPVTDTVKFLEDDGSLSTLKRENQCRPIRAVAKQARPSFLPKAPNCSGLVALTCTGP